jgi:ubiquinone/menaquinone biosynthesis C-methylase UbiE
MASKRAVVSPVRLQTDLWSAIRTYALAAAAQLRLFDHVAAGHRTAAEVAAAAGASERGTRGLLDALTAMGYLRKSRGRYALTPESATYLVSSSEFYMEGGSDVSLRLARDFANLAEAVRTGAPVLANESPDVLQQFWPLLVKQIFPANFVFSSNAVRALSGAERKRIARILDIGAGSGAWSIAFAQALPKARVTAVDLPFVLDVTRSYTRRYGVDDRYEYRPGSFHDVEFGREVFDLAILGHIIHSEGAQRGRKLIGKVFDALAPGGMLLIAEFIPNDERTGPVMPLLFGLNMLVHAPDGDVFTMREYREWLKHAGFRKIRTINAKAQSPLILATK